MSLSSHLLFTSVLGIGFPLFVVAILFVVRFLPDSIINIPHRDYGLAAERRADTFAWLFRHSLWFAFLGVGFVTGVHHLIVRANAQPHVQMATPWLLGMLGCFLAALAVWAYSMIRHFRRAS